MRIYVINIDTASAWTLHVHEDMMVCDVVMQLRMSNSQDVILFLDGLELQPAMTLAQLGLCHNSTLQMLVLNSDVRGDNLLDDDGNDHASTLPPQIQAYVPVQLTDLVTNEGVSLSLSGECTLAAATAMMGLPPDGQWFASDGASAVAVDHFTAINELQAWRGAVQLAVVTPFGCAPDRPCLGPFDNNPLWAFTLPGLPADAMQLPVEASTAWRQSMWSADATHARREAEAIAELAMWARMEEARPNWNARNAQPLPDYITDPSYTMQWTSLSDHMDRRTQQVLEDHVFNFSPAAGHPRASRFVENRSNTAASPVAPRHERIRVVFSLNNEFLDKMSLNSDESLSLIHRRAMEIAPKVRSFDPRLQLQLTRRGIRVPQHGSVHDYRGFLLTIAMDMQFIGLFGGVPKRDRDECPCCLQECSEDERTICCSQLVHLRCFVLQLCHDVVEVSYTVVNMERSREARDIKCMLCKNPNPYAPHIMQALLKILRLSPAWKARLRNGLQRDNETDRAVFVEFLLGLRVSADGNEVAYPGASSSSSLQPPASSSALPAPRVLPATFAANGASSSAAPAARPVQTRASTRDSYHLEVGDTVWAYHVPAGGGPPDYYWAGTVLPAAANTRTFADALRVRVNPCPHDRDTRCVSVTWVDVGALQLAPPPSVREHPLYGETLDAARRRLATDLQTIRSSIVSASSSPPIAMPAIVDVPSTSAEIVDGHHVVAGSVVWVETSSDHWWSFTVAGFEGGQVRVTTDNPATPGGAGDRMYNAGELYPLPYVELSDIDPGIAANPGPLQSTDPIAEACAFVFL